MCQAFEAEIRVFTTAPDAITRFEAGHRFLSNFFPLPIPLVIGGIRYITIEHAYQSFKTLDVRRREWVASAPTPGVAKRRGRQVALRDYWSAARVTIMASLLTLKFSQPELYDKLVATGRREIVEGNSWGDVFWGARLSELTDTTETWVGENTLGESLMLLRTRLRNQGCHDHPGSADVVVARNVLESAVL